MVDPDPTPDPTDDATYKYGNFDAVQIKVAIEHSDSKDDMILVALDAADAYIESNLLEQGLDLPTEEYPNSVVQAATNYAIADTLQPFFTANEEENKKVVFYMNQADKFLNTYIQTELNKKAQDGTANGPNPYCHSQSSKQCHRHEYPLPILR